MDEKTKQYVTRILIVVAVALIGSYISRKGLPWLYDSSKVNVSERMPEGRVFGIVWTIIYVAFVYAWCTSINSTQINMDKIFLLSIVLNFSWVVAFFWLKNIELAKYIILALSAVVAYQAYQQWQDKNTVNTLLMLVYLSWLLCATGINFETSLVTDMSARQYSQLVSGLPVPT
jgi:benzodiazapine receptor